MSRQYVSERMKNRIDETTSSMFESGIHRFYVTFTQFLTNLRAQKLLEAEDESFRALNMDDLKGPLVFCSGLLAFAWFVFILEALIKWLKFRYSERIPKNLILQTKAPEERS